MSNLLAQTPRNQGRNVPDFFLENGIPFLLVTDPRGSVRLVVNTATGGIEQRLRYDEWGRVQEDTNPARYPFTESTKPMGASI